MNLRHIIVLLLLCGFFACSTQDNSAGGGTSVSNPPSTKPVVPQSSVTPDFESNIFETAVTDSDTVSADVSTEELRTLDLSSDSPAGFWTEVFLSGPVTQARLLRRRFFAWGERIAQRINDDPSFSLSTTEHSFTVANVRLITETRSWTFSVALTSDDNIKIVISDAVTGIIWGYYLISTDENGEPERGIFAYVDPLTLGSNPQAGTRFVGLAFDFRDTTENRMSFTFEAEDPDSGHYVLHHIKYQCDKSTRDCLGEFISITAAPPVREFSTRTVRYAWNDDDKTICIAPLIYSASGATLGEKQQFIGPVQPSDDSITSGCDIGSPYWAGEILTTDDLPLRGEDNNLGGFSTELSGDGLSETTWESLVTMDVVEDWLLGHF